MYLWLQLLVDFSLKFTASDSRGAFWSSLQPGQAGHVSRQNLKLLTLSDSVITLCPLAYQFIIIALSLSLYIYIYIYIWIFCISKNCLPALQVWDYHIVHTLVGNSWELAGKPRELLIGSSSEYTQKVSGEWGWWREREEWNPMVKEEDWWKTWNDTKDKLPHGSINFSQSTPRSKINIRNHLYNDSIVPSS